MIGRRPSRGGFTLVELLLVVSLVAVIGVETGFVFRAASSAYRRAHDQMTAAATAEDALWLVARDVAATACPTDPSRPTVKAATASLLRLRTTGAATGRPEVVDYFLYDDSGCTLLVRRGEPIRDMPGVIDPGPVAWEIVAADVEHFNLRFHDGTAWRDDWTGTSEPTAPRLIEVTLTVAAADGRRVERKRVLSVPAQPPSTGPEAAP